jgi:putative addiction module antidote
LFFCGKNPIDFPVKYQLVSYNICDYTVGMIQELKLRKVGNSLGVLLSKETLARLNIREGDSMFITESTDGGYRLTIGEVDFERKMEIAKNLMRRYHNTLRELAK